MRCLYVTGNYETPSETFIRREIAALRRIAPELDFATLWGSPSGLRSARGCPPIHVVCPAAPERVPAAPAAPSLSVPPRLAVLISLYRHRRLLRALREHAHRNQATLLHAASGDLPGLLVARTAARLGLPYSIGFHAADVFCSKYPLDAITRDAFAVLACNSAALAELHRRCPRLAPRLHLVHHGLPLGEWPFQPADAAPPDRSRFLFVGRLVAKKGLQHLLRAVADSATIGPNCRLRVLGDGPLRGEWTALAQQLGVSDRVEWAGRVSEAEVRQAMRSHAALVVPSIDLPDGNRDGIPNVVVEAMATGLPVIGTQAGALGDLLDTSTGWPTPAGSGHALAAGIADFATASPTVVARQLRHARERVERDFDTTRLMAAKAQILLHGCI